jgi:hypothetical protein
MAAVVELVVQISVTAAMVLMVQMVELLRLTLVQTWYLHQRHSWMQAVLISSVLLTAVHSL